MLAFVQFALAATLAGFLTALSIDWLGEPSVRVFGWKPSILRSRVKVLATLLVSLLVVVLVALQARDAVVYLYNG
jgi:hypothetical protein